MTEMQPETDPLTSFVGYVEPSSPEATEAVDDRPGVEEMQESLDMAEETAIIRHFGQDWPTLPPTRRLRAMAFIVERRRKNEKGDELRHFEHISAMKFGEVAEYFTDDDEDDEATEVGKDASPLA